MLWCRSTVISSPVADVVCDAAGLSFCRRFTPPTGSCRTTCRRNRHAALAGVTGATPQIRSQTRFGTATLSSSPSFWKRLRRSMNTCNALSLDVPLQMQCSRLDCYAEAKAYQLQGSMFVNSARQLQDKLLQPLPLLRLSCVASSHVETL